MQRAPRDVLPNQPKKERVSNPTPYPSAHMMTAAIIFWRVDDGFGGRCRGCTGVTPTGGGPATCMSPQTGAGQRLGLRRRRVCLSLMAGMRRAPGIAEEGERARPSGARPPRAIGAPGVVKVVGGGWAGRQPAPWEAGSSFVRRRWTIPVSRYSRSAFGPVPLSRSDAHGIGGDGHCQGRHLPFHQGPATHTPRDERTELVSFHRSSKALHAPPYPARRTVGLDRSLAISRG